ncbi:tyrosine-type recombinase/integrase [Guyparkeria sp.]|uniref:tyrosine-type recombinase/integrase n=1 Tax=Guyparkeria sp. TaxID=2035736 RepID=UPI003970EF19
MPRVAKELSAAEVRRLTRPGFHAVGGVSGLLLQVKEAGGRSWVLRARVAGKRRAFGLGSFPEVSLSLARDRAREMREQLRQGIDPAGERKKARDRLIAERLSRMTFSDAVTRYHKSKAVEFKSAKHRRDWISSLERYAVPKIGGLSVSEIELPHVLKVLEPIWTEKTETATRVRQRLESVLSWATVSGYRTGENPARWRGNLEAVLPKPGKVRKVQSFAALPWQRVGEFVKALRGREGTGARALEFLILTASRSGEVRGATWAEIDLEAKLWTIPGERMKAGKPHRVPLSDAAARLLADLPRTGDLVFAAPRGGMLSDMGITSVIRRMHSTSIKAGGEGYTDPNQDGATITAHGFRSAFKDWARSRTSFADEVSELALAHVSTDATRAAYARDELLPQRSRLMDEWAAFCAAPMDDTTGKVVAIGEARA